MVKKRVFGDFFFLIDILRKRNFTPLLGQKNLIFSFAWVRAIWQIIEIAQSYFYFIFPVFFVGIAQSVCTNEFHLQIIYFIDILLEIALKFLFISFNYISFIWNSYFRNVYYFIIMGAFTYWWLRVNQNWNFILWDYE